MVACLLGWESNPKPLDLRYSAYQLGLRLELYMLMKTAALCSVMGLQITPSLLSYCTILTASGCFTRNSRLLTILTLFIFFDNWKCLIKLKEAFSHIG